MNNSSMGTWTLVAAVIAVAMAGFSLHAGRKQAMATPDGKGGNSAPLEMRLDKLASQVADLQRVVKKMQSMAPPGGKTEEGGPSDGSVASRLDRLEQLVEASGMARLVTDGNWNAEVLKRVNEQYQEADKVKDRRKSLLTKNSDLHRSDEDRYGKQLDTLYETALLGLNREASQEEIAAGQQALEKMKQDYPEAYATGMLMAEEALSSALEMNVGTAEAYYQDLRNSSKFKDIVTDTGIEAVPAIQSYLVREYIQAGRIDEANTIIQDMEKNYSESIVPERSQEGSQPTYKTASETAGDLRKMVDSYQAGEAGPRMGPGQ